MAFYSGPYSISGLLTLWIVFETGAQRRSKGLGDTAGPDGIHSLFAPSFAYEGYHDVEIGALSAQWF